MLSPLHPPSTCVRSLARVRVITFAVSVPPPPPSHSMTDRIEYEGGRTTEQWRTVKSRVTECHEMYDFCVRGHLPLYVGAHTVNTKEGKFQVVPNRDIRDKQAYIKHVMCGVIKEAPRNTAWLNSKATMRRKKHLLWCATGHSNRPKFTSNTHKRRVKAFEVWIWLSTAIWTSRNVLLTILFSKYIST